MTNPFDLETFLAQPRVAGLTLSPDGERLVVGVATTAADATRFRAALWQVDPDGEAEPRQLTRSAPGEASATFAADGSLLFTSARPDPDAAEPPSDPPAALWRLPADGGEAELLAAPPAGVAGLHAADDEVVTVVAAEVDPRADDWATDQERAKARSDAGVTAMLFENYPIRHWDRWLGPREPALWQLPAGGIPARPDPAGDGSSGEPALIARGMRLHGADATLSPDGSTLVTGWRRSDDASQPADVAADLISIHLVTGERRILLADGRDVTSPAVSPDGRSVVAVASDLGAPDRAQVSTLVLIDLDDGSVRDVAPDLDLWPQEPRWLPSGDALVFSADDAGHRPVFRVDLATDEVTRLTAQDAYTDVCVAPDGQRLYALHAAIGSPPRPVRLDTSTREQQPTVLPSPAGDAPSVATVERLVATADDGVQVGSWLVLPRDADGPVPLVTFIHGGPLGSWNSWQWRWNPHVLADAGYAVLLPDPALSTGYGRAFIQRGWGRWGERPYTDLMSTVDAAAAHPSVDDTRLAAAGGSFGGYMANWVAGQTDRFECIVTHASLWSLPGFHGTTDLGLVWEREFGDPYVDVSRYEDNSPDRHVTSIRTPMLVIHGEKDLRVPISEGLMLWTDLARNAVDARFLYFPDENHWILKPQHARLWYQTVLGFLAEHLRDAPFERPELL